MAGGERPDEDRSVRIGDRAQAAPGVIQDFVDGYIVPVDPADDLVRELSVEPAVHPGVARRGNPRMGVASGIKWSGRSLPSSPWRTTHRPSPGGGDGSWLRLPNRRVALATPPLEPGTPPT